MIRDSRICMGKLLGKGPAAFVIMLLFIFPFSSTPMEVNASPSTVFTLDPKNVDDSFFRQHLANGSDYPVVSPEGQIYLTQDPSVGSRDSTLYNVGRLLYKKPIQFRDDHQQIVSFSSTLRFKITTGPKYNESGDGLAFTMTTDKNIPPNSTGRFLGLMPEHPQDRHERFFAVEFDTFQNLQKEINDPSASHIGIDINNLSSVAYRDTAIESNPLYLYHNWTFNVWIDYNASSHLIQVWATNDTQSLQPPKPVLSCKCNLTQVFESFSDIYVGIISASGNNTQASILYSWSFYMGARNNKRHISGRAVAIAVSLAVAAVAVVILCASFWIKKRRQYGVGEGSEWDDEADLIARAHARNSARRYTYSELQKVTDEFSDARIIGEGTFSVVYQGVLSNGKQVAVKKMKDGVRVDARTIAKEVEILAAARHRHLLQLQGWCYERPHALLVHERPHALLVYDYVPGGSLAKNLFGHAPSKREGTSDQRIMDGETRFRVLCHVASALAYLHGQMPGTDRVLHRDVKAENVLLSSETMETMEGMLADFGLSRLIANDQPESSTDVVGTWAYMAPEVITPSPGQGVDDKADVYSFGMLALEVACGRRALDKSDPEGGRLADRVWLQHKSNSILQALDPQILQGRVDDSGDGRLLAEVEDLAERKQERVLQRWQRVLHLGLLCCQVSPKARPAMNIVHHTLEAGRLMPLPDSWTQFDPVNAASSRRLHESSGSCAPVRKRRTLGSLLFLMSRSCNSQ